MLKKILFAILVVLVALLLPMVMVVCLFSGRFQVDTAELQRHVEANLTAADVQLLRSVEDTMAEIEFAMIDAELSSEVGAAQALYIMALYDYSSQPGFVSQLVSCFGAEQTDDQLVANVNAAFGTDIVVQDFTNVMRNVRSRRIDTTKYVDCGTKNNLDLVQWAISSYQSRWGYVMGTFGQVLTVDLKLGAIETHVADSHTCCLHPASSTHRQMTDGELDAAGVGADLIRLSCGLENAQDLIEDIAQALENV